MQSSWQLALNILSAKRLRTALMLGAVALASSLIVAVAAALISGQASLEWSLARFIGTADCRIIHPAVGRFDETLLEEVRAWPGVSDATGRLAASLVLVHEDRRPDAETGRPLRIAPDAIGLDFDVERRFRHFDLIEGRMPDAADELLMDSLTAERLHAAIGDVLLVDRHEDATRLRVVGIYQRQRLGALQRPRVYVDRGTLGAGNPWDGEISAIYIKLDEGEDPETFCTLRQPEIPDTLILEPAEMVRTGFDQRIRGNEIALIIGTILSFMSAGFIVLVGLTTGVTERERELALLRCLGAARRQLFAAQMFVGLVVGGIGALLGIPIGIAVTTVLTRVFDQYFQAGLVLTPRGSILAMIGGLGCGVLGGLYPAVVAARVAPLQGLSRPAQPLPRMAMVSIGAAALALLALQLLLALPADAETRFWAHAWAGAPSIFAGWFLLAVPMLLVIVTLATPLVALVFRVPRDLLRGSILATPIRNGLTAGALMIGMAVLVSTWSTGLAIQQGWLDRVRFADGFAMQTTGITPETRAAIAALPFVDATCPIGYLPARIVGEQMFGVTGITPPNVVLVGFDPEVFFAMNAVEWFQGTPAEAIDRVKTGDAAIVAERFLVAKNVGLGDRLTISVGRATAEFEIVGVVGSAGLDLATQLFGIRSAYMDYAMSCVFVDFSTVREVFDKHDAYMLQIDLADDVDDATAETKIHEAAPGVIFRTGRWITRTLDELSTAVLAIQSTVALAALLLASLAVGNVIAANVHGRRYEYGVVRAVGGGRGLLLRLILAEAVVLALTGSIIGALAGLNFAIVDIRNLRDLAGLPVNLVIPFGPIGLGTCVTLLVTLLAALPTSIALVRRAPAVLIAAGRND